jgi:hypothetical protein
MSDWSPLQTWLSTTPLWILGACLFCAMLAAMAAAIVTRRLLVRRAPAEAQADDSQEGYVVSAVLGLLALLLGFTFSLAVDRFDSRRHLVLQEANAIGTAYLRAQLLPEPHRERMSGLLIRYTDNRLVLAKAGAGGAPALLARNDALVTDIWTAVVSSFASIKGLDFSSAYVESINEVIDLGSARKAARLARVPSAVFGVLFVYMVMAAGVLGYVLRGARRRFAAGCLLLLLTISIMLIIDIDRPISGRIIEGQGPMEDLRRSLAAEPPAVFDRWTVPPGGPSRR